MLVCTLHWYQRPGHLEVVAREMERLGPPRLRGYLDPESGAFLLREGTHRINAAHLLGLAPVLVPVLVRQRSRRRPGPRPPLRPLHAGLGA